MTHHALLMPSLHGGSKGGRTPKFFASWKSFFQKYKFLGRKSLFQELVGKIEILTSNRRTQLVAWRSW